MMDPFHKGAHSWLISPVLSPLPLMRTDTPRAYRTLLIVFLVSVLTVSALTISGCDFYAGGGKDPGDMPPPPQGTVFPDLEGQELREALRERYAPDQTLGYGPARDTLYRYEQYTDGALIGEYTAFSIQLDPNADASSDAYEKGINAEHTLPQSKGAGEEPAKSDLHNLFPAKANVNSARGNTPFDEIPDDQTDSWYFEDEERASAPTSGIAAWSEDDSDHPDPAFTGRFEPREDHKGDAARAVFYMRTIYPDRVDAAFFRAQREDLLRWNSADPADGEEAQRAAFIAELQGTTNPFVKDSTLARRAFGLTGPTVNFAAPESTAREGSGPVELVVTLTTPGGQALGETVSGDVAFAAASSSAQGADIDGFTSASVTFPAGTESGAEKALSVPLTDDDEVEGSEAALFEITGVEPSEKASAGFESTFELTIEDNDVGAGSALVINEFMADPNGDTDTDLNGDGTADSGDEFVEIYNSGSQAVDLSGYQLDDEAEGGGAPYTFPEGTELAPGAYAVVIGEANGRSFGSFTASGVPSLNNGGDDIRLVAPSGTPVAEVTYSGAQATEGVSQARSPNGTGAFAAQTSVGEGPSETAGQNNETGPGNTGGDGGDEEGSGASGSLVVTELMADPDATGDSEGEYFEVYNATDEATSLEGYVISDDGSDSHTIGSAVSVAPGAFAVLATSSDPVGDGSVVPGYVYSGIAIANGGDEIVLTGPGGTEVARLVYTDGDDAGDGVSLELMQVSSGTDGETGQSGYTGSETALGNGDFGSPGTAGVTEGT